ncbi:unnamed protein product [Parnassius mnemosyne]|uniref:Uncharacterized protein n=1 Tax=Parnassius mnemosyne TaxID=213953 RepID=A0AAV1KNC3_9NEOP
MNFYKDYIQKVRLQSLQEVYFILCGDISPKLYHYLQLLTNVKLKDGSLQEYYGEVKKIINSFIIHWTDVMNDAIKEVDKLVKEINKEQLLILFDKTIDMQIIKQVDFEQSFLPIQTPEEQKVYDEILVLHDKHLQELSSIKDVVSRMHEQEEIESFAREHFANSLRKKNGIFAFTHTYIALMLTTNLNNIRVSLEEIVNRTRNNLHKLQDKCDEKLINLLNRLYNKNKEHLELTRQPRRNSVEIAELQQSMKKLKNKIEDRKDTILSRLSEEFEYWNDKLKEFNQIAKTITKLKDVEQKLLEQQQTKYELKDTQISEAKVECFVCLGGTIKSKLEYVKEKKTEAARSLLSFFSVRGPDRIFYTDSIGRYYVDEYGHQVYFYDYGLKMYHVNCAGEFVEAQETEAYYYDSNGRYVVNEEGGKLYKIAPCTSSYQMVDDLLVKYTNDCGHSEQPNKKCRMDIRDHSDVEVLPSGVGTGKIDIKGTLDENTALYLWNSFGHVLPEVLYQVASEQPKNPIHCLAHKLARYKYNKTLKEMQQKREDAEKYRAAVYRERENKAIAASKAWKAKQPKRSKPEDSGEGDTLALYGEHIARQEFIRSLAFFYT